ncbi:MAG: electron transfer flavoprotein subunit alpha [Coriobacteriia bacterium]|nr:electron transfer flavoprotein subunit alpha [Coriobacteriia bacterium]
MAYLKFNQNKIGDKEAQALIELCPFNAIERDEVGNLGPNSACKNCKICVKKGPVGCVEFIEEDESTIDKSEWRGITVFAEHDGNAINPVVFELLNKARELAAVINHPVYALWIGDKANGAEELLHYGADKVFTYLDPELKNFSVIPYTAIFEQFIDEIKPSSCLVGATNLGRSLGPRIAARLRTGMTADCTRLEMRENTDLVQIRPAFGGNIMAKILTQKTRPQFCTVREKIFNAMERTDEAQGEIVNMDVKKFPLGSKVNKVERKEKIANIADAEILVAIGRGLKKQDDIAKFQALADKLGGQLASSRALVEAGWMPATAQIGLSGKTVKPKLLITFGISGAVQFAAGMNNCERIVAVNTDEKAPIFDVAHVKIVADMYDILEHMMKELG